MKRKRSVTLLLASIVSYAFGGLSLFCAIMMGFNILGVADYYGQLLTTVVNGMVDIESQIFMVTLELAVSGLVSFYFGKFYLRAERLPVKHPQMGKSIIFMAVMQMLFCSFIPAIFGLIAGIVLKCSKPQVVMMEARTKTESGVSDVKLTQMTESVTRLNELRSSGAISEEDYYKALNRVLEG
ncbi:MAG: hypothetical protein E7354_04775 [Clostridiales bacterium]|nr:hypothetical protein [Clostridiales bacterium]